MKIEQFRERMATDEPESFGIPFALSNNPNFYVAHPQ